MKPEEIYKLRYDAGLTIVQMANLVGVTHTTWSRWEQGANAPAPVYMATLRNLREKVNELQKQNVAKNDIAERVGGFLLAGGILAFLIWVFNRNDK